MVEFDIAGDISHGETVRAPNATASTILGPQRVVHILRCHTVECQLRSQTRPADIKNV